MKKLTAILALVVLCCFAGSCLAEEAFDPTKLFDWYDENVGTWMTVKADHWHEDISAAPTDEELEQMFQFAVNAQTGLQWAETFFLVVRDPAAQQGIIGDNFGTLEGTANEGTVTVLVLVDNILPQEEHLTPYQGEDFSKTEKIFYFQNPVMASFDAGITCGMLNVAATALGYSTHYFAYPDGELIGGLEHDMSYFLSGNDYTRLWGFQGTYEDESNCVEIPVEGNSKLVAAIVIGKPNPEEDVYTYATMQSRPDNYEFWD